MNFGNIDIEIAPLHNSAIITWDCAEAIKDILIAEKKYEIIFDDGNDIGYKFVIQKDTRFHEPLSYVEQEEIGQDTAIKFVPKKWVELHFYKKQHYAVIVAE